MKGLRIFQYGCGKMSIYTMRFAVENGAALKISENYFTIVKNKCSNVFMFDKTKNYKLIHLKNGIFYGTDLLK